MALYEQGVKKIVVTIRKEAGAETSNGQRGAGEKETPNLTPQQSSRLMTLYGTTNAHRIKRINRINATHAIGVMRQVASYAISYEINGQAMINGDSAYGDAINRSIEVLQDTTGVASAFLTGALYGSGGGLIGAVVGSLASGTSAIASLTFKYINRQREYDYKMFKIDSGIEYKRARANISLTNGRLR